MFYSDELLSLRRRGKLAACWLAANLSEKMFKENFRSTSIKKIDIVCICEEILSTFEIRNGRISYRLSLYLSSQLMYGVAKVLFYQTKLFQDQLFVTIRKLHSSYGYSKPHANVVTLELPEIPPLDEVFRELNVSPNLHLIVDEPYTSTVNHLMRDEMNFGIMSFGDMDKFLLPGEEKQSLNGAQEFRWLESIEAIDKSEKVPLVDIHWSESETIVTEKKTRLASAETLRHEPRFVVDDHQVTKLAPETPKKRSLVSPTEVTPKKRSRISFTKGLTSPIPSARIEPPLVIPETVPAPEIPSVSQEQATVPFVEDVRFRKLRRRKLFDKRTIISNAVMRKCIENVIAHTVQLCPIYVGLKQSANKHLGQPSVKIINKSWGKTLTRIFKQHLIKPLVVENEFPNVPEFEEVEVEQTLAGEAIRADITSGLRDQTGELLSKLVITTIEGTDTSKMLEKILPTEDIQTEKPEEQIKEAEEIVKPGIALPDVTGFEEKIGEEIAISEKPSDERKVKSVSKRSPSLGVNAFLTKRELIALMEVYWRDAELISFYDLVSPQKYNRIDAACTFLYCLELHKEKFIIMKQVEPFDTIWIEKYSCSVSESDEEISTT
ncbi:unnamed protein product [Xylocopa violacea]|uniref:Rad21/Rec8-like protein N-terminal domain-containing protein n=1 Tax=Xylocopa violacea TaxID=135666 RepID=A0ABP1PC66_XYLVO